MNEIHTRREAMPLGDAVAVVTRAMPEKGKRSKYTVAYSVGAGVRRYDFARERAYMEVLEVSDEAIDASRFAVGIPLLNTHSSWTLEDQIGICENHRIEGTEARCDIAVATHERFDWVKQGLDDGTYRSVSVGYVRQLIHMEPPEQDGGLYTYRVKRWQPMEVSIVPIPADIGAGTRSADETQTQATRSFQCEVVDFSKATAAPAENTTEVRMTTAVSAPAALAAPDAASIRAQALADAAAITELCQRHKLPDLARELIASGADLAAARASVLDARAAADESTGGQRNVTTKITTVSDEKEVQVRGIVSAIEHRLDPSIKIDDNSKRFAGRSTLEICRALMEVTGRNTDGISNHELAGHALHMRSSGLHTAADFPSIMANVANKRLRQAYEQSEASYMRWARRAPNARDFKPISVVQLGGAPGLLQVNEHGEFTSGTMAETAEGYQLVTRGRIVGLTRQAIVNDDLRAFDRLVTAFGLAARRLENQVVYSQLTANANMGDGVALFHATHANLGTGGGSALSQTALGTGRSAMRLQRGLASELLNIAPAYLIVPAALEQLAYQLTSSNYVPAVPTNVNEFAAGGRTAVEAIIEPELDAASATAWYLAGSTGQIDTVEYCYLDGAEGARIEQQVGFEMDGMQIKCAHDFAAKPIDFRGLYKANGA